MLAEGGWGSAEALQVEGTAGRRERQMEKNRGRKQRELSEKAQGQGTGL